MRPSAVLLLVALGLEYGPGIPAAAAAQRWDAPPPSSSDEDTRADPDADEPRARNAGSIDGVVTAIDYQAGTMTVAAGVRKVDVTIQSGTTIQGPANGFRTIADIKKGARVRVLMSERGKSFTAQIITLR